MKYISYQAPSPTLRLSCLSLTWTLSYKVVGWLSNYSFISIVSRKDSHLAVGDRGWSNEIRHTLLEKILKDWTYTRTNILLGIRGMFCPGGQLPWNTTPENILLMVAPSCVKRSPGHEEKIWGFHSGVCESHQRKDKETKNLKIVVFIPDCEDI